MINFKVTPMYYHKPIDITLFIFDGYDTIEYLYISLH